MKKQTALTALFLVTLIMGGGTVLAQTAVQADTSTEADINTGGGLGKGINSMVRGILGDDSSQARSGAPTPEPSLMMQMNATMDTRAPIAPQAAKMSAKSAPAAITAAAMTDADLGAYVHEQLAQDSNIQSIDTSDTHVRITYAVPSTVFRFVRVTLRVTVGASASGATEVTYPWYAFGSSAMIAELKRDVNENVAPLIPKRTFTPDEQKTLIDGIHVALAAKLGSSTGGDR